MAAVVLHLECKNVSLAGEAHDLRRRLLLPFSHSSSAPSVVNIVKCLWQKKKKDQLVANATESPAGLPFHPLSDHDRPIRGHSPYLWRRSVLLARFSGGRPQSWQCTALEGRLVSSVFFVYGRAKREVVLCLNSSTLRVLKMARLSKRCNFKKKQTPFLFFFLTVSFRTSYQTVPICTQHSFESGDGG